MQSLGKELRGFFDVPILGYDREIEQIRQSEALNHAQLRRLLEVEVAGIVPAAHVHPRDVIAAFVLAVRCGKAEIIRSR